MTGAILTISTLLISLLLTAASIDALQVRISTGNLLKSKTDGRVVLLFAPEGQDPLDDIDATGPDHFYGKNAFGISPGSVISLKGGSNDSVETGVYGFPSVRLDQLPEGKYNLQAFLTPYETVHRSDGSVVKVHFPCGDGSPPIAGVGSLQTDAMPVTITTKEQTIHLTFSSIVQPEEFTGNEIGGCSQGNYASTDTLKYVKIRSKVLSSYWKRDMYIGANVVLPAGYNSNDKKTRYPVIYNQGHWPGSRAAYGYTTNAVFKKNYDAGFVNGTSRAIPKFILVTFRHETPFYDDSYAVNTANLGPYGDAINDELVPHLEKMFHTIREPYARIQDGGSTGGWESIANAIFRPDMYGTCFTYYPDSLDFHKHQDINLYDNSNAYVNQDGSTIGSVRQFNGDTEEVLLTVAQENHWELTQGTSSRSQLQWDVWNTVFGIQGLNGYPLEPWNKVTGEIYHEAVEYWREMDLSDYIGKNWKGSKNLGDALRDRIHVSVGTHDDYYLNEGVALFKQKVESLGGPDWANITIIPGAVHGGLYLRLNVYDYLDLIDKWVKEHAPGGPKALTKAQTSKKTRGNYYSEVTAKGGHKAALARQASPKILNKRQVAVGETVRASVGRWDPGVVLTAQWTLDGKADGASFSVKQFDTVSKEFGDNARNKKVRLDVKGKKYAYKTETRQSNAVKIRGNGK